MTDGSASISPKPLRSAKRRLMFVLIAGALAIVGALIAGYYFAVRPVTLKIAVGPANSDDLKVVQALALALQIAVHVHDEVGPLAGLLLYGESGELLQGVHDFAVASDQMFDVGVVVGIQRLDQLLAVLIGADDDGAAVEPAVMRPGADHRAQCQPLAIHL